MFGAERLVDIFGDVAFDWRSYVAKLQVDRVFC